MPSELFQPLLHDPLGWKQSTTSYTDHYKWRKLNSKNKDKLISAYSQRYQRQLRKQKTNNQRQPLKANEEQPINRVIVLNKCRDNQQSATYRYLPTKTPVYVVEQKPRPATANVESTCCTQELQRPPTAPPAFQEETSPPTEVQQSVKEETKEKEKRPVDANNDNSRHWLTFPTPKTPQKIIDAKQRLGQLNIPSTLARPSTASNPSTEKQQTAQPINRPSSASAPQTKPADDQHRFLSFEKRETPDDLRAARYRLDKHRYNVSIDNYPPRPQTCPERRYDSPKPITPPTWKIESPSSQPPKADVWVVDDECKPATPASRPSSSSKYIQIVNCDNVPSEYATALEISNAAQKEYERNLKINAGRKPDNVAYRLPTMLPDNKNVSCITYQNPQQMTGMDSQVRQVARSSDNDLGVWIRNATDRERASALKIVQDVLNPSHFGYDRQASNRTLSGTRKLGRTRTQHKFPCEICEKLLIKRHVWDLSGLEETLSCPRHP
ncbi:unnamed protein product [Adineta ricciae]|uniref:Uncharacterized protein n=1 Tax=Adineta ricciae TaxID=249248 RepID=A0A815S227_ADIRI|nr:unnamed protein product [Adineta ricciae]